MSRGKISVEFGGRSVFLQDSMPHEVRDHELRVVGRGLGSHVYPDLEPGLYLVEAVDTTGARTSEMVEVIADETSPVTFAVSDVESPAYAEPAVSYPSDEDIDAVGERGTSPGDDPDQWTRQLRTSGVVETTVGGQTQLERRGRFDVELLETVECGVVDHTDRRFVLAPVGELTQTPRAVFAVGQEIHDLCLPLHDRGPYPVNAAIVLVEERPSGARRPIARFTPERRVASALDRMIGTGAILDADDMFREASNLLLHKYRDPPAAALGGLTMYRLGRLAERSDWVRNLARGFPWLPDGAVLQAALWREADDPDLRNDGLDLLLDASERRPMFTDGLSLMMDLLRRWPGDARAGERRDRIRALAPHAAGADLDSTCLSVVVSDELLA